MADIRAMCAIGLSGQLGLRGSLPWEGRAEPEFAADVARFFDVTRGHVLLVGPATKASIPDFAYADRSIVGIRSTDDPEATIAAFPGAGDLYRRRAGCMDELRASDTALGYHQAAL